MNPNQQPEHQTPTPAPTFTSQPVAPTTPVRNEAKGLAIASMILGILSIVLVLLWFIAIPLALTSIVLGIVSLAKKRDGKGMSITGIITAGLTLLIAPFIVAVAIVSYNSVVQNANITKARANAVFVQKIAEAYSAEESNGSYPSLSQLSPVPTDIKVQAEAPTEVTGLNTIQYVPKSTSGACIGYWDFSKTSNNVTYVFVGDAKNGVTGSTCS